MKDRKTIIGRNKKKFKTQNQIGRKTEIKIFESCKFAKTL